RLAREAASLYVCHAPLSMAWPRTTLSPSRCLDPVDSLAHELAKKLVQYLTQKVAPNAPGIAAGDDASGVDRAIHLASGLGSLVLLGGGVLQFVADAGGLRATGTGSTLAHNPSSSR